MAATTAAIIAGVATVAATGASVAQSQGAMGGGGDSGNGDYRRTPLDPHQRAMRDYYARMAIVNQDSNYPGFGEFLSSGGDPKKANFDLVSPGMKPSEAAALGLTGGRGEAIRDYDEETNPSQLTPEQRIYLAKERRRHAAETGSKMPPNTWAEATINTRNLYANRRTRLEEATAVPEGERTLRQRRAVDRLPGKLEDMRSRHTNLDLANTGTGRGAPLPVQKKDDGGSGLLKRVLTGGTSGGGN